MHTQVFWKKKVCLLKLYTMIFYLALILMKSLYANILQLYLKKGEIEVKPMSYFAEFLLRFIKTKYIFKVYNENMVVILKNQEGLKDITVAVPKEYIPISSKEYEVFEDETFRYIVIKRNLKETNIYLSLIK